MIAENAEIKAPGVWGNQEASQPGLDSNRSRGTGQTGGQVINQPLTAYRDDRQGGNFTQQRGQATLGGIVDRLISKTLDLIQESEERTAELKVHLKELKELSKQFHVTEESQ